MVVGQIRAKIKKIKQTKILNCNLLIVATSIIFNNSNLDGTQNIFCMYSRGSEFIRQPCSFSGKCNGIIRYGTVGDLIRSPTLI